MMKKILLTSVFRPFGVDDEFGRKENKLELFHNQLTREQGAFSIRMHHESFGLHLIAANIESPAVVLDFPTFDEFEDEVKRGDYDYIGISFIVSNFSKARRMAERIRELSPRSKIVLGGHGVAIEGVNEEIPHDYICIGDGVGFFRELLKEGNGKAIVHPAIRASFRTRVMGAPSPTLAATIVPGLGCPMGCQFCTTSHFFGKKYIPFFKTGRELFEVMERIEEELGTGEFFIMDENFLKYKKRANDLFELVKKHNKKWSFFLFSSADTLKGIEPETLLEWGVYYIWLGIESKYKVYRKNKGVDFKALIKTLRNCGVSVIASSILFMEHHTPEILDDEVAYAIDLSPDFIQFMALGVFPGTALYKRYKEKRKLKFDIPYEEWHGTHRIWFEHPRFEIGETDKILKNAFLRDLERNGPSILRMADTTLRGYQKAKELYEKRGGDLLEYRIKFFKERALRLYIALKPMKLYSRGKSYYPKVCEVLAGYEAAFGEMNGLLKLASLGVTASFAFESLKHRVLGDVSNPPTIKTCYRCENGKNDRRFDLKRFAKEKTSQLAKRLINGEKFSKPTRK
ncbi:MAG: hypothetical protein Kow0090_06240 [Myxococcota bacterium]